MQMQESGEPRSRRRTSGSVRPSSRPLRYDYEEEPLPEESLPRTETSRRRTGSAFRQNDAAFRQTDASLRQPRRKKKRKKKAESFLLFYLLPFIILNTLLFLFLTAQPDFTLTLEEPTDLSKVTFTVETRGRLSLSRLTAMLDDVPVELTPVEKDRYTATVDRNGTLEVVAGYINGMTKTQYEHISTIDDQPPTIIGEELDGTRLTVSFEDAQSSVNFDSIYAMDAGGARVLPESVDPETASCVFQAQTNSLEIHVSDICGNEAVAFFDDLLSMGNTGEDRTGDYHRYGTGNDTV